MKDNTTAERGSVPQKLRRLIVPILALACTVVGGLCFGLEWLFAMILDISLDFPLWAEILGFSLTIAGLILAVTGLCLYKKVGRAGIVLSVIAIVDPLTLLTLLVGGLEVSLLIFGM